MRNTIWVLAVLAAIVCVQAYDDKLTDECETELGLQGKIITLATYRQYYPCILACVHEKMGVMSNGKILSEKYFSDYVPPTYGDYGELNQPKLLECVNEANGQSDKCDIERSLNKCMYANWRTIFPNDVY